jgi:hypothetical protein
VAGVVYRSSYTTQAEMIHSINTVVGI